MAADLNQPVELSLPADPSMMLVARLTAAGVIARAGCPVDRMDELKLAVEEACVCLIDQPCPPERLRLRFACEDGGLRVRVSGEAAQTPVGAIQDAELEIMRCILLALVDEADIVVEDGWISGVAMKASLRR